MRALILIAGAALLLSSCGSDDTAADTSNVDTNLAADDVIVNDTTAIDAALGADANMAADVELNLPANDSENESRAAGDNESAGNSD